MSTARTPQDPRELRAEIERTRADLGDTVRALAGKTDVKSRARETAAAAASRAREAAATNVRALRRKAAEAGRSATETGRNPAVRRAVPPAVAATALVAGIALVVRGRRRS